MKTNTIKTNSRANAVRISKIERRNRVREARKNFIFWLSSILLLIEPIILDASDFINFSVRDKVINLAIFGVLIGMFFYSTIDNVKPVKRKKRR